MNHYANRLITFFIPLVIIGLALSNSHAVDSPDNRNTSANTSVNTNNKASIEKVRKFMERRQFSNPAKRTVQRKRTANKATDQLPEIQALARGFQNDPIKIFEFVRNQIDHVPTFGSMNSATDTLLALRGNDWDQASLLIATLRAAGFTANYQKADVTYNSADLANWLDVENDLLLVLTALVRSGIPAAQVGATAQIEITRVWVEATLNGTVVQLDPAMVAYQPIQGLDIDSIINYERANFITRATTGATQTDTVLQNLNRDNIRADLKTFSVELIEHIRSQTPDATVEEIIGGREITAQSFDNVAALPTLATALPFAQTINNLETFAEPANAFRHTLRIQYEGIDKLLFTDSLNAERLTLTFNATNNVELRQGDTILATGNIVVPDTRGFMQATIDHPYALSGGTFLDQTAGVQVTNGVVNVILYDFNHASQGRVQHFLDQVGGGTEGDPDADEAGTDFQVITQLYTKQHYLFNQLLNRVSKVHLQNHHLLGIYSITSTDLAVATHSLDIPLASFSGYNKTTANDNTRIALDSMTLLASGLEHLVIQQANSSFDNFNSISAVRLLDLASDDGEKIFKADAANWNIGENIRGQLQNYNAADLAFNDELILNQNLTVLLPENGARTEGDFTGFGSFAFLPGGGALTPISGGTNGGQGTVVVGADGRLISIPIETDINSGKTGTFKSNEQFKSENPTGGDPIAMGTGVFEYNKTDLTIGSPPHFGLKLQRMYNSSTAKTQLFSPMGRGWGHNLETLLFATSDSHFYLGKRQAVEVADTAVMLHILFDQMNTPNAESLLNWMIGTHITQFQMEQAIFANIVVSIGEQTMTFNRLQNGEFAAPPNTAAKLTQDIAGLLAPFILTMPNGDVITFDSIFQGMSSWRDSNGNQTDFTYDGESQELIQVTNNFGDQIDFTYNGDGQLTSATDHSGRTINYSYDALGNLISVTDADGNIWRYQYDANSQMTAYFVPSDAVTPIITTQYDTLGRVITQSDRLGNTDTFFYTPFRTTEKNPDGSVQIHFFDKQGQWIGSEDSLGNRQIMKLDGLTRVISHTDREGKITQRQYHPQSGNLSRLQDAKGNVSQFSYTKRGAGASTTFHDVFDLTRVDYADGTNKKFQYDANGNRTQRTDEAGKNWVNTYNAEGQILTSSTPTGGVVTRTYDANGNLASSTDTDRGTTTYAYDSLHRITTITRADGSTLTFTYDGRDNILTATDGKGNTTTLTYDQDNLLTTLTDADGETIQSGYDVLQRLTNITDREGAVTTVAYDALNRITGVTDPTNLTRGTVYDILGRPQQRSIGASTTDLAFSPVGYFKQTDSQLGFTEQYQRSDIGELESITDPLNRTTAFTYDQLSRITQITDPLNRSTQYSYDPRSPIVKVIRPLIGDTDYTYNDIGALSNINDLNGSNWGFTQTPMGRALTQTDPKAQIKAQTYDNRARLNQTTYADGNTQTRTYDNNSNITRRLYTDGTNLQYTYDKLDRTQTATDIGFTYDKKGRIVSTLNGPTNSPFNATYDGADRLTSVTYDGGMTVTYTYDAQTGLLKTISDNLSNSRVDLIYDNDRRLIKMERSNNIDTDYTLDAASQVSRIKDSNLIDQQITYDAAGQIKTLDLNAPLTPNAEVETATENFTYNNASESSATGNTFDKRGRQTQGGGRNYQWDDATRLTDIDGVELTYNGVHNIRTRKQAGQTSEYFYNHAINTAPIMAEKVAAGFKRFYVWTPAGDLLYSVDVSSKDPAFYHFDITGNTLALTDKTGEVVQSYAYSPYGKVLKQQGTIEQLFTFVGKRGVRQEGESGELFQMRLRYFDTQTARFLSREKLWPVLDNPQMLNPYQYAFNDPILKVDPSGLEPSEARRNFDLGMELINRSEPGKTFSAGDIRKYVTTDNGFPQYQVEAVLLATHDAIWNLRGDDITQKEFGELLEANLALASGLLTEVDSLLAAGGKKLARRILRGMGAHFNIKRLRDARLSREFEANFVPYNTDASYPDYCEETPSADDLLTDNDEYIPGAFDELNQHLINDEDIPDDERRDILLELYPDEAREYYFGGASRNKFYMTLLDMRK